MGWNRKRSLFKNHRNACLPATELGTDKSWYGDYIIRHWNWMNSYWMFWIAGLSWRFSLCSLRSSQWAVFVTFEKLNFVVSSHFSPFWEKQHFDFSDVLHKENYSLYLCLNITNFYAMDFSERRPEEVMFLLTFSVFDSSWVMTTRYSYKKLPWGCVYKVHTTGPI